MSEAGIFSREERKSPLYYGWLGFLALLAAAGLAAYLEQIEKGLSVTGMSRDISWGFYVSNFTFLVGVAASAVMLVIPAYLHGYGEFRKIVIFGEWVAVSAVAMSLMFIMADMGQPQRALNILLHPTPHSILFWDMIVLFSYLGLNLVLGWQSAQSVRSFLKPPAWVKKATLLSIPLAIAIHTVTAFLYSGLPGRHFWLSAIMAPRFLASAFASGPAFLFGLIFIMEQRGLFSLSDSAYRTLRKIMTYAMVANLLFLFLEFFTAAYSGVPSHLHTLEYLYFGLDGKTAMRPWAWLSLALGVAAVIILLFSLLPSAEDAGLSEKKEPQLKRTARKPALVAALFIFVSTYIDKGLLLVIGGFIPNPLGHVTEYRFTGTELLISAGIWAIGLFLITLLFSFTINLEKRKSSREEKTV